MPWFEVAVNSRWKEQFGLVLLQLTLQSKYLLFPENGQKEIAIGKNTFYVNKIIWNIKIHNLDD